MVGMVCSSLAVGFAGCLLGLPIVTLRAAWAHRFAMTHNREIDDQRWAALILEAGRTVFPSATALGLYVLDRGSGSDTFVPTFAVADAAWPSESDVSAAVEQAPLARVRRGRIDVIACPMPGTVVVLSAVFDRPIDPNWHERRLLDRVALRFDAACRLRSDPAAVVAEMAMPDDSTELWSALTSGRVTLVPTTEGGGTRYLLIGNHASSRARRALTSLESEVLALGTRGLPNKVIGYQLGVSNATVSKSLATAAVKLGFSTERELLRFAALRSSRPHDASDRLTSAEKEVLELVQRGMTNRQIARHRARSVRTIANQIATLLRKTKSTSRRALIVGASS